ncbi:MAG: hypothetical protein GKR94_25560 [Gammaproteobacteria bacterium]|nr:hypothetical protein [Gammaproteobacteria bacterium]
MSILFSVLRDRVRPERKPVPPPGDAMLRVFIGYDDRQTVAYHVAHHSLYARASRPLAITPLAITPLVLDTLPLERRGLTLFTYSRFLVPWLCNFSGWALLLDPDMLVRGGIAELFGYADPQYAVMVVKNTERFEWASAILFNCAHRANQCLTPYFVDTPQACRAPHRFDWLDESLVGAVPGEWNHTVGYDEPRAEAKWVHYTQGVPLHPEVAGCEYEGHWNAALAAVNASRPWSELMGPSVHAKQLADGAIAPKLQVTPKLPGQAAPATPAQRAQSRAGASERYQNLIELYKNMHTRGDTLNAIPADKTFDGRSLVAHLRTIADLIGQFGARTVLDYGCGKAQARGRDPARWRCHQ